MVLQGGICSWLEGVVGIGDSDEICPSVLCGVEGALLSVLAAAAEAPLHYLLSDGASCSSSVAVNGLLNHQGTPEECAAAATELVSAQGFSCLKIKVRP